MFGTFNIKVGNIRSDTSFNCIYNSKTDRNCPIFRIGDIIQNVKSNEISLLREGGLIEIEQIWSCNFDFNADSCYPEYNFRLLQSGEEKNSPGLNYRYAQKYYYNGTDYRTLVKLYGIRFIVTVTGQGGRFDAMNLFLAIGSGIGFLAITSIICDFILLHIHRNREKFNTTKFTIYASNGTSGLQPHHSSSFSA
ncbi:unnamed protein product [Didymodactylos carnosus]|uniref:Purinergic receptor n=1 Tax=Didymodactylos carnosus TaxID=1234261 RepID=A0A8S2F5E7_9BILA|nr:unnamed protein product [Didymodactylos carnosus]CAF4169250.1 unnamed protein product [Didymodactylos carnosus]